jgi:plastocyanin
MEQRIDEGQEGGLGMRRMLAVLVLVMAAPGVALAGGGEVDVSGCAGYGEGNTISMRDSCFAGTAHFVPSDTPVAVRNDGAMDHSLTAVDGAFDTGLVAPGDSAQLSFDEPGIYRVFCSLHGTAAGEGMAGVVVVGDATPASMAAPLDIGGFEDAVAVQARTIRQAMENQGRTMGEIRSLQGDMSQTLAGLENETSATPQMVAVPEVGPERLVVLILVGLAAGIALASLLTVLRLRIGETSTGRGERFDAEAEVSPR